MIKEKVVISISKFVKQAIYDVEEHQFWFGSIAADIHRAIKKATLRAL